MNKRTRIIEFYQVLITLVFIVLFFSLFNLQIIKGNRYKEIAEKNFFRIRKINAARGIIYDSKLRPIAQNVPSINLYFRPFLLKEKDEMVEFVSSNLPISKETINKLIYENRFRSYDEIILYENIQYDTLAKISEKINYYPSLFFKVETMRNYSFKNHFTGYVGRINEREYNRLKDEEYTINSMIGKSGLEKYYERLLSGQPGYEVIQVDAQGKNLNLFTHNLNKEPENGLHLVLTVDSGLQNYISEIYPKEFSGAVVVMNPLTGGIISYNSFPEYDQNWFAGKISQSQWSSLSTNKEKPLLDRVINGTYPPGSTFKPVTGSFGLEKNIINETTRLAFCSGGLQIGNRFFKCWSPSGHGTSNILDALRVSCDVFFYDLSSKLKLDEFEDFVRKNKLIDKTGVDLPFERKGFFPTTEWYRKRLGKNFSVVGRKANLAIGQGEVLVTPLELCAYYSALANNGVWTKPHILERAIGSRIIGYKELYPDEKSRLPISQRNLAIINEGLWQVCNSPGGTGGAARVPGVKVFGKSGSAENAHGGKTHAWFACYAEWENPELAIVVFLENAGHGGSIAAPIAGKIIQYYEKNVRVKNENKN